LSRVRRTTCGTRGRVRRVMGLERVVIFAPTRQLGKSSRLSPKKFRAKMTPDGGALSSDGGERFQTVAGYFRLATSPGGLAAIAREIPEKLLNFFGPRE